MLKCPTCGRVYEDERQTFCLNDGAALMKANPVSEPTVTYRQAQDGEPHTHVAYPMKKKSNTALILIGVAALVALLFVGVIASVVAFAIYKSSKTVANVTNTNVQPTPVKIVTNSDKYAPELKKAINDANAAQAGAYLIAGEGALSKYYSGEALKMVLKDVADLKKAKAFHLAVMQQQQFESFNVNDAGTEAEVRVTETWKTTVYRQGTTQCLLYYPSTVTPQTVSLKKSSDGWTIDSIIYDPNIKRDSQPCPKKK